MSRNSQEEKQIVDSPRMKTQKAQWWGPQQRRRISKGLRGLGVWVIEMARKEEVEGARACVGVSWQRTWLSTCPKGESGSLREVEGPLGRGHPVTWRNPKKMAAANKDATFSLYSLISP